MIVTARQVQDLHRQSGGNGQLTLPYRAKLTPLASDWIRSKKLVIGYSDVSAAPSQPGAGAPVLPGAIGTGASAPGYEGNTATIRWWCDGPCGPAKAAVTAQAKESNLRAIELPADAKKLAAAIKLLAQDIKSGQASAGVLLVQSAAVATVFANRCPSLRAVVGTCLEAVEQGVQQAAANVLVIEHPYKTLPQVKSLLGRFVRGRRELSEELRRQLQELSSCG